MQAALPPSTETTAPGVGARIVAIGVLLVTNAIPLYGVQRLGWSVTNVLVIYWLENLLVAVFTCLRVALHRAFTRKRGHWRAGQLGSSTNGRPSRAGLLGEYATVAFVFTFAHGVFVAVIALLLAGKHPDDPLWRFSWPALRQGALMLSLVLAAGFVADLPGLRSRSFAWIKGVVQQRMGRVLILHLAIIFGMPTARSAAGVITTLAPRKRISLRRSTLNGSAMDEDRVLAGIEDRPITRLGRLECFFGATPLDLGDGARGEDLQHRLDEFRIGQRPA